MAEDTGGLLGFFGRGYDPQKAYEGLLSEQPTKDAMMARSLAAMAGAFGQGAMPSPYKGGTPFLATLGQAAQAAYGGQDELIKARNLASESLLRGTQADVARQNLDLNKTLLKARLGQLDAEEKASGGGLLSKGPAGLVGDKGGAAGADGETYWTPEGLAALRPTEGKYDQIHYPSGKTPDGTPSTASGAYGYIDPTWVEFATKAGVDVTKYPRAYMAPPDVQDRVAAITPISHWTGVSNGKPFNAAAQKLATNPAFVTTPPPAGTSAAPAGMPPALFADVPSYSGALGGPQGAETPSQIAAPTLDKYGQPAPTGHEFVPLPNGRMGMRALPGPQGLLGPEPSAAPPALASAGPAAPSGGPLGPQIQEAVGALAQQAGGRPAQFAGPGAADPAAPPGPPAAAPNLVPGGGARPPIAPVVTGQMPPMPSWLLAQPGPAGPPPAAPPMPGPLPGAGMPPMPVQPAPAPAPPALPGGAPTPQQIIAAKRVAAIQEAMGRPVDPITAKIANFNIEAAQAGANAAQTAAAQQPYTQGNAAYDAQVKAQYQVWVDRMKPREIRPGAIDIDPVTGQTRYNPAVVEGTDPKTGDKFHYHSYPSMTPGGVPTLVPIMQSGIGPGTTQTLTQTAAAQPITVGNQVMQKGPGYTEPIVTPAGSTIPPANSAAPITGTKPNLDKRGEQFATIENDWGKSVAPAAQAVNRVEAIMSAMKIYETGTWASKKSEIVGMLKSVGINLGNAVDDPAQAQIILKNNFGTALNIMQSTGLSRWTQAELFGAQANSANPDLWAKANHAIGAQTIGVIDWEQQMLKDYRAYKKYDPGMVDPHDFQQRWVEANPLQAYVDRAHERIGPLKGEPAAETPQTYRHPSGQIYPSRTVPDGKGGFKQQYLQP